MYKQATKKLSLVPVSTQPPTEKPTAEKNKTNLGKRKQSGQPEGNSGASDLDSAIMNEARKKIQKVTHSHTIAGESVEKKKSEIILESSFIQSKIACACGEFHTITLSNDGTAYSFGRNDKGGALGLGHNNDVSLPTPIPNLPKINMISCGSFFTVCVDHEGFIWSFGDNNYGQLGTGNTTSFNVPQKIQNIPPVLSVSCGGHHTLMITNDDDSLWACGNNQFGQLCQGDKKYRSKPQKTSFSNIWKVSSGFEHSLFQNNKGEIFSCGYNEQGQCGLGHFEEYLVTPSLILNAPSNIVQFVCGYHQSLFLDSEGNVFSVGSNGFGELGLGHNTHQNELKKIPNIPPIKIISCVFVSSYLIDFERNLWTFGNDGQGQLGHGDIRTYINTPKISTLKDIQQISYGNSGFHFFAKNSQNQIFASGNNDFGQLGIGYTQSISILEEINSQYSTIWRDEFCSRAKSARK